MVYDLRPEIPFDMEKKGMPEFLKKNTISILGNCTDTHVYSFMPLIINAIVIFHVNVLVQVHAMSNITTISQHV